MWYFTYYYIIILFTVPSLNILCCVIKMEYSWWIDIAEGFNGLIIYKGNESRAY